MTEHDPRAVAALGLALYNAAWTMDPPITTWGAATGSKAAWERAAAFVLSSEARLVAALEHVEGCGLYGASCQHIAREALRAHRASRQPSEPVKPETLAEAVEEYCRVWPEHGRALEGMRAALAREREKGKP